MKTCSSLSVIILGIVINIPTVFSWWDNGHMLCGQVAKQVMDKSDVAIIERLLSRWDEDFPGTSTITTAAIWADQLKCTVQSTFCASPSSPSISHMEKWHYVDLPLNVNGTKWKNQNVSLELFKDAIDGDQTEILEKSLLTMQTTKSTWAANFVIRNFIHVMTDLHQPLHTAGGISITNPGGDAGGNLYKFAPPCAFSNLHGLWDSGAGLYAQNNWANPMDAIQTELEKNATNLLITFAQVEDPVDLNKYQHLNYDQFVIQMGPKGNGIKQLILDSYTCAQHYAYKGLDLTYLDVKKQQIVCPSSTYVQTAQDVIQRRIVLAGKHLAVFLTQFANQIRVLGLDKPNQ